MGILLRKVLHRYVICPYPSDPAQAHGLLLKFGRWHVGAREFPQPGLITLVWYLYLCQSSLAIAPLYLGKTGPAKLGSRFRVVFLSCLCTALRIVLWLWYPQVIVSNVKPKQDLH